MNDELYNLIGQFMAATNTKNVDINSIEFKKEFLNWLKMLNESRKFYLNVITYMSLNNEPNEYTAEIYKSKYDSVIKSDEPLIITAFNTGLEDKRLIKGNFKVSKYGTCYINNNTLKAYNLEINTFMTQNPYNEEYLNNWEKIHNNTLNKIIVGYYGKIYDKDKYEKMKTLKRLSDNLDEYHEKEFVTFDDNYYAIVASKKSFTKKLTK